MSRKVFSVQKSISDSNSFNEGSITCSRGRQWNYPDEKSQGCLANFLHPPPSIIHGSNPNLNFLMSVYFLHNLSCNMYLMIAPTNQKCDHRVRCDYLVYLSVLSTLENFQRAKVKKFCNGFALCTNSESSCIECNL